ncbi:MAG: hypothetical protein P8J50_13905 [Acidimicrobiales bacterium]|jgi:hypothetical protein|nr:hypothetical protein [Acidimicrobiales bacterium]
MIEPDEPERRYDHTLAAVSGTLEIAVTGDNEARAPLVGLVVEYADGQRLEIGDHELLNDCWGCFAG